jgi:A/G-specific adenine glycosylase
MSIAFNQPVPALDANAFRVVSRLQSVDKPFSKCKNEINGFLSEIILTSRPGDFNQAIMDLGRNICTPINPHCNICPLSKYCSVFINKTVSNYPVKLKSKIKPHYRVAVGIIWKNDNILISKRQENGLLGGLWEFPGGKIEQGESPENCIIREVREELGVSVKPTSFLKQIKHAYTHFSITLDAYHCEFITGIPRALGCSDWRWVTAEQIQGLPFPKANHKLFDKVLPVQTQC